MKIRRLVILGSLLGALILSASPASAGERISQSAASLSNTTISGYVDSAVEYDSPAPSHWWHSFLVWLDSLRK